MRYLFLLGSMIKDYQSNYYISIIIIIIKIFETKETEVIGTYIFNLLSFQFKNLRHKRNSN